MNPLVQQHLDWQKRLLGKMNPTAAFTPRQVFLSHGRDGLGEVYPVTLHHPQEWMPEHALEQLGEGAGIDARHIDRNHPEARHFAMRLQNGGGAYPVIVHPDKAGGMVIAGSPGGSMNGLPMSGILSEPDYRKLGITRNFQRDRAAELQSATDAAVEQQLRDAAKSDPKLRAQVTAHVLPMEDAQAIDYAKTLHHIAVLQQDPRNGHSWRAIAPEIHRSLIGSHDDVQETGRAMQEALPEAIDHALASVLHAHPQGAKKAWLDDFLTENAEPVVVIAKHPQTQMMAYQALEGAGRKPVLSTHHEADLAFAHPSKEATADALVTPNADTLPQGRPYHVVALDTKPAGQPDPLRHLSFHHLTVEGEQPYVAH